MDYTALDEIVIFRQCEVRKCVNLSITEDLVDERDELFTYHLTSDVALHPRIKLYPANGEFKIKGNKREW